MQARSMIAGPLMAVTALVAAGCLDPGEPVEPTVGAAIQFVNATGEPLEVLFDGHVLPERVPATRISSMYFMVPGQHTIGFRNASGGAATVPVTAVAFQTFTAIGLPGEGATPLLAEVREDTNAAPVAGRSKLRVMHLAANAPAVDVWRTQPDVETATRVMTPFNYGATSTYLQSEPGAWRVWVTPVAGTVDDTLARIGPIQLDNSGRATVYLLDSAGVLVLRASP